MAYITIFRLYFIVAIYRNFVLLQIMGTGGHSYELQTSLMINFN